MKDAWSGQWRREWIITKSQSCSQGKKLLFYPRISQIFLICISQMFLVRICWIYFSWPTSDLSCSRINFWCRRGQELGHAGCDFWICICEATMPQLLSLSFLVWVVLLYFCIGSSYLWNNTVSRQSSLLGRTCFKCPKDISTRDWAKNGIINFYRISFLTMHNHLSSHNIRFKLLSQAMKNAIALSIQMDSISNLTGWRPNLCKNKSRFPKQTGIWRFQYKRLEY